MPSGFPQQMNSNKIGFWSTFMIALVTALNSDQYLSSSRNAQRSQEELASKASLEGVISLADFYRYKCTTVMVWSCRCLYLRSLEGVLALFCPLRFSGLTHIQFMQSDQSASDNLFAILCMLHRLTIQIQILRINRLFVEKLIELGAQIFQPIVPLGASAMDPSSLQYQSHRPHTSNPHHNPATNNLPFIIDEKERATKKYQWPYRLLA